MTHEIAASAWELEGGFSHALMEIINAVRRTRHAKKSYAVISIAPVQGRDLAVYRCGKHLFMLLSVKIFKETTNKAIRDHAEGFFRQARKMPRRRSIATSNGI